MAIDIKACFYRCPVTACLHVNISTPGPAPEPELLDGAYLRALHHCHHTGEFCGCHSVHKTLRVWKQIPESDSTVTISDFHYMITVAKSVHDDNIRALDNVCTSVFMPRNNSPVTGFSVTV